MEEVVSRQNMLKALRRRVEQNRGAPGIDNLTVENLRLYLCQNWLSIREQLLKGEYKPQPVLRVEIPKPDGEKRLLGIPTVIDRLIQQALLQILTSIFAPDFSPFSFGFRPHQKAHDAVRKAKQYLEEGYQWVVDLDLEKFFDHINHDTLMAGVARKVKDKRILKLIRLYLNTGVMVNGVKVQTGERTPQGGPLNPLLANILLDDLDKELGRRGHRFVRYADDCNYHERIHIRIAPQAIKRFKIKIREITSRSNGQSIIKRILRLNLYLRGWILYFSLSDTPYILQRLEGWKALSLANARKAYWHMAGGCLNSALPNAYWANLGLMSLTQSLL